MIDIVLEVAGFIVGIMVGFTIGWFMRRGINIKVRVTIDKDGE